MNDYAQMLGTPVEIQGQSVVVVPDIIGNVPVTEQHEYVEICKATNVCAAIHMRESELENIRQNYPKHDVYGLWQILVASDKVNSHAALQIVPTTAHDGFYVHADVGRIIYSGNYDAGFFAADTAFRLSNASHLTGSIDELRLPDKPALLAQEILAKKHRIYRSGFFNFAATFSFIVFLSFTLDFSLQVYSERNFSTIYEKDKTLKIMKNNLKNLSRNKLVKYPDQSSQLYRLAVLINDLEDIKFDKKINLKSSKINITARSQVDPGLFYDFIESDITPDGRWSLIVDLKG